MATITTNPVETCGHETCDMEPCSWGADMGLDYARDSVWGWATTCDRCDGGLFFTLPEDHWNETHA